MDAAALHARVIVCGMIARFEGADPIRNITHVLYKKISIHGFGVLDLQQKYALEFYSTVIPLVATGQIKHREHDFGPGLDKVGDGTIGVLHGKNEGKAFVHIADEQQCIEL